MPLQILSDGDVKTLLDRLDGAGLAGLLDVLADALCAYSVAGESRFQAHRQQITRPENGLRMLFMPATLASAGGCVKMLGIPAPGGGGISGTVLVADPVHGRPIGLVNAATLTGFRTALGSMLLFRHRTGRPQQKPLHLLVFGAGVQAQWHLRLALLLQTPAGVASITVVNRSAGRAQSLVETLQQAVPGAAAAAAAGIRFSVLTPADADHDARLRAAVLQADAIFCTTPARAPIFPGAWLTDPASADARAKTRFIAAIGSYSLDMQELDPALLRTATADPTYPGSYSSDTTTGGGSLVVESREATALEAGEVVLAGVPDSHLLESGEIVHRLRADAAAALTDADKAEQARLAAWLRDGNVIYKSVGLGLMDLAIGKALLDMGAAQGVGTTVEDF